MNSFFLSNFVLFNMFVKFYLISIHAIILFDFIVAVERISASHCMQIHWDQCDINQIDVSPADRMIKDNSVIVDRGSNITISFNFTPHFETYNLKWSVWVETVFGDYKVEGIPNDARNFSNHPILENKINPFWTVVHISNSIRAKLWVLRVTIMGDDDQDKCCFLCKIRVREPQTTTVSSTTIFDPTNPYDIIRKQVSYPSIWDFNKILKNFQNDSNVFNKFIFNNTVTTPKPGCLMIVKTVFKRLLGIESEPVTTAKVPFLGNASSLMEYFNDVILSKSNKKGVNQRTMSIAHKTSVNIEPEHSANEIITEKSTFSTSVSSSKLKEAEIVKESKADPNREDVEDYKTEDSGNDFSMNKITTTTTVQTTRTRSNIKVRTSQPSKKKIVKSGAVSTKAARAGIKKTVRPGRSARPIAKSTTS